MLHMALAVCWLFDRPGERLIRQLWRRLEEDGVPTPLTHTHGQHWPHLSLAVVRDWDLHSMRQALAQLPPAPPPRLMLPGTLAFTRGRAAVAVAVTADIARRQEHVVDAVVEAGADLHRHYVPGRWLPHISMTTGGTADRLSLVSVLVNDALPIELHVASAALIDSGTGQLWPLATLP